MIASNDELVAARRMRTPPDFFELRLDYLPRLNERESAGLKRPLIVTARSAMEGGSENLDETGGRDLLLRFLPYAAFVDVELRSLARLKPVWDRARREKIRRICSLHDLNSTPSLSRLIEYLDRAIAHGADVFKLVTRSDSILSLRTLLDFLNRQPHRIQLSVMAVGKFGGISRILFPECGSAFVYAPLRKRLHDGQLTFSQLRQWRHLYAKK